MDEQQTQADIRLSHTRQNLWLIPIAILAAGALLAVSIYVVRSTHVLGAPKGDIASVTPVSSADHLIGSPSAPVMIIEYADIDSSYSKSFQKTMEQLMTEYGPGGKVGWVYRHFPLIDQYPNSEEHAEAAECASALGNGKAFWSFIDLMQAYAPGDQQFDPSDYDTVATSIGIDSARFDSCMTAHTYLSKVNADITNGVAIGVDASPYLVVLVHGQKPIAISGSLPYDAMKKIVDESIAKAK
ncbi:MAG TPA: thioredoxin domain-containing protein [Candidatus Paceibacterota bacterium]|nr:thioredoxin domain-containing protein [Candidatus Paceibacterota bacterium]